MTRAESPFVYLDQASLNRIADKEALNAYLRKKTHKATKDPRGCSKLPGLGDSVRDLVQSLPPEERKLIRMRYWEDLTLEEIAFASQLDVREIKAKLVNVLAKLRGQILPEAQITSKGA